MLALSLLMTVPYVCKAQEYSNTPVTLSKEKVKVGGKMCWSHIVLEKQTLYSISKAYNVSIEDIYALNPSIKENGLKKNSIILIPIQEMQKDDIARKDRQATLDSLLQSTPTEQAKGQKIHVRKWYEDLEMIARMYGVSVESIVAANNLKGKKLANRQRLVIPAKEYVVESEVETFANS